MGMGCGMSMIKYLVFIFNLLCAVSKNENTYNTFKSLKQPKSENYASITEKLKSTMLSIQYHSLGKNALWFTFF